MIDPPIRKRRGRPPSGKPRAIRVVDYAHVIHQNFLRKRRRLEANGMIRPCLYCQRSTPLPTFCSTTCANFWIDK